MGDDGALGPIGFRTRGYAEVRDALLDALVAQRLPGVAAPPLARLQADDPTDWLVALVDGWAGLAEIIGFYQDRIANEAFWPTATDPASIDRIALSLGRPVAPHTSATTTIAYHLTDRAAGVEAVARAQGRTAAPGSAGAAAGTARGPAVDPPRPPGRAGPPGLARPARRPSPIVAPGRQTRVPHQAQVRAVPGPGTAPPTFVTQGGLTAIVGASRLGVQLGATGTIAELEAGTTRLELDGVRTGLSVGEPILILGTDAASGTELTWVRLLTSVEPDPARACTRVGWDETLGAPSAPFPAQVNDPLVYGFGSRSSLVGSAAPAWSSLTPAARLAAAPPGGPPPQRGGLARSADGGRTWQPVPLAPPGVVATTARSFGDLVLVATSAGGLLRSAGGGPFAPAQIGGARRPIGFLGGTRKQLLACGANGAVYTSVDDGRSWSPVTGGPPTLAPADPAAVGPNPVAALTTDAPPAPAPAPAAAPAAPTTGRRRGRRAGSGDGVRIVAGNQLPSVTVRAVLPESGGGLVAATDAGVFRYKNGNWAADGLAQPAFALLTTIAGDLAAGAAGVWLRAADGWHAYGRLAGRVYALALGAAPPHAAVASPVLYAATDAGVAWTPVPGGEDTAPPTWTPVAAPEGGALPHDRPVTALVGTADDGLIAGTSAGPYRWTPGATRWTRCDRLTALTVGAAALAGAGSAAAPPPAALVWAFADQGIVLDPAATLQADSGEYVLRSGADEYRLLPAAPPADGWDVLLVKALSDVAALADDGAVSLLTAGPAVPLATEWPGFAVAGTTLELAPPVRTVPPASRGVVEQRVGGVFESRAIAVRLVEQDSVNRFGTQSAVTRIATDRSLDPRRFPRRATRVWTVSVPLPLFVGPPASVPTVAGRELVLASDVGGALPAGRLTTISGRPIGLTVAPLGGLLRVDGGTVDRRAAAQLDVADVAVDAGGAVYAATSQGVTTIPAGGGPPRTVADAAPSPDPAGALAAAAPVRREALALLALADGTAEGTVCAALKGSGVHRLDRASSSWMAADPATAGVVLLAADGSAAVGATAAGALVRCAAPGSGGAWTALPPLGAPVVALTARGGTTYAATAGGVWALPAGGAWAALPAGAAPRDPHALAVDGEGTLWAATAQGLFRLVADGTAWTATPGFDGAVTALAVGADGTLHAAAGSGLRQSPAGGAWTATAGDPAALVTALAAGADGALWLASSAALPLPSPARTADRALELRHALVFEGTGIDDGDRQTLDQGGLPSAVVQAFADRRQPVDLATAIVAPVTGEECWTIRTGPSLAILVLRRDGTDLTLDAYRTQAVASALGPAREEPGGLQRWPVRLDEDVTVLRAPKGSIVALSAAAAAPALSEVAVLAQPSANAEQPVQAGAGTVIRLRTALAHVYDAATVQVDLNVVPAVQGRPVSVPIGSGDPQLPHQAFAVPSPVAVVPGPTGAPTTSLQVAVGDERWTPVTTIAAAGPEDQVFVLRTRGDGTVSVHFGDGVHGARLPAGRDNVVATYLQGGGAAGEVAPGVLLQPLDRPQLVSAAHNPTPALRPPAPDPGAAAGADVRGLGRAVTLADLADLACAQPGVSTAAAELVGGPRGREVVVSISGTAHPASIATALATASAPGLSTRVLAATPVAVGAEVEVTTAGGAPVGAAVAAALSGLSAERPGAPLRAADVLVVAQGVPGVVAARVVGWHRAGSRTTTRPLIPAAPARPGPAGPQAGELLVLTATVTEAAP